MIRSVPRTGLRPAPRGARITGSGATPPGGRSIHDAPSGFPAAARRLAVAIGLAALLAPVPSGAALVSPISFQECDEALLKLSSKLLKKRTATLLKCHDALLACALDEELGSGDFATCAAGEAGSCNDRLARLADSEAGAAAKLATPCGDLRDRDFGSSVGIGFRRLEAQCGSIHTEADATACFVDRLRCHAGQLAEAVAPRIHEFFTDSGIAAEHPEAVGCLVPHPPSPAVGGSASQIQACQAGLARYLARPFYKSAKDTASCLGDLHGCLLNADRLRESLPQPPACYTDADKACTKADARLDAAISADARTAAEATCIAVTSPNLIAALGFADPCPSAVSTADVVACVQEEAARRALQAIDDAAPRTCQLSLESGRDIFTGRNFCTPECGNAVVEDGESCDDGNRDGLDSCDNDCQAGPTASQAVSLPATAQPAHCPDGTLANAVSPSGSVATQFGTTTPDLNNVSYVRYYAPGAGDADAVLVLVPGFAGGAHSLKLMAETMVAKAAAAGTIVLEVWTFDRRTDQLEDDEGGELAESEDDPALAIDWYFGAELGLALDGRLSRRAVFHDDTDIPFIANFTYNMFIHDIDVVVDAAHAMPGSPTVFLGGHSLGTLFSARYAATDLDPGVGLEAGHDKVAGLVLFEGGGDSMPTGSPSADALDLVIAKADGGRYHAIASGAAACWDGTPCPGGDVDCAARPLPPGALTNKCVQPVDAFAGGVISPEIHAVGDAVALQARRHPDSLSIAQVDFGAGSAVEEVPGLALLGALPLGSAEATVGFFLDDDYSPEVSFQTSMGFSTNGGNVDLGDYFLASSAGNDPYRVWLGYDAASMPPEALVDHGAPADAFDLNGVEKEMTPMAGVLTMIRTGDRNIGDWYFPDAGLKTTEELIVGVGGFTGGLDSTPLSVGRGRPDIENLTEGPSIDIPIIAFGGSNGISPTPGAFLPFAESVGACTAASCDGTPRIVASDPVSPVYGGAAGGFEAYVSEGYAHIDVVAAEDDASHNEVYAPLLAFLERNTP